MIFSPGWCICLPCPNSATILSLSRPSVFIFSLASLSLSSPLSQRGRQQCGVGNGRRSGGRCGGSRARAGGKTRSHGRAGLAASLSVLSSLAVGSMAARPMPVAGEEVAAGLCRRREKQWRPSWGGGGLALSSARFGGRGGGGGGATATRPEEDFFFFRICNEFVFEN